MLPKERQMWFKALLNVDTDLEKVWKSISHYNRVNLGGEQGKYTVYFTGRVDDGMAVLEILVRTTECQIDLNTGF